MGYGIWSMYKRFISISFQNSDIFHNNLFKKMKKKLSTRNSLQYSIFILTSFHSKFNHSPKHRYMFAWNFPKNSKSISLFYTILRICKTLNRFDTIIWLQLTESPVSNNVDALPSNIIVLSQVNSGENQCWIIVYKHSTFLMSKIGILHLSLSLFQLYLINIQSV